MNNKICDPIKYHIKQLEAVKPSLAFDESKDFALQRDKIKAKFLQLINMPEKQTNPIPLVEYEDNSDPRFDEIRFLIETEPEFFVPAHMLLPKDRRGKLPVVICLQGHTPGMHTSLAREAYPSKTPVEIQGDRDFCIQAVARGYVAIAMEQRGFGELNFMDGNNSCHELSWQAAMMGKTLMGERVRDIIAMLDAIENGFDFVDMSRVGVMGNSGGGTSAYFAACVDERIKVTMPASSFCTFVAAWGSIHHCDCSYIPGILNYMEMPDMAMMIAPRYLIAVNGIKDHLQPYDAAKSAFETVKKIYASAGAPNNCTLVTGDEGHRFYADLSWGIFDEYING